MPWLKEHGFASVINLRFDSDPDPNVDASRSAAQSAGLVTRVLRDGWTREAAGGKVRAIAGDPDQAIAFATAYLDPHAP